MHAFMWQCMWKWWRTDDIFKKVAYNAKVLDKSCNYVCNTVFAKVAHKKSDGQLLLQNLFLCNTYDPYSWSKKCKL